MPLIMAIKKATKILRRFFGSSSRRLISLMTTVWAPVPTLYRFAMSIRFSIVSNRACSGVMSAGIRDLKKCWEKHYGYSLKYGQPTEEELTEYGRISMLELPVIFSRMGNALAMHNVHAHRRAPMDGCKARRLRTRPRRVCC